jgi:hypothetical protein
MHYRQHDNLRDVNGLSARFIYDGDHYHHKFHLIENYCFTPDVNGVLRMGPCGAAA